MLPAVGMIWEGLGALGAAPEVAIVVFWSLAVAMVGGTEFFKEGGLIFYRHDRI